MQAAAQQLTRDLQEARTQVRLAGQEDAKGRRREGRGGGGRSSRGGEEWGMTWGVQVNAIGMAAGKGGRFLRSRKLKSGEGLGERGGTGMAAAGLKGVGGKKEGV